MIRLFDILKNIGSSKYVQNKLELKQGIRIIKAHSAFS